MWKSHHIKIFYCIFHTSVLPDLFSSTWSLDSTASCLLNAGLRTTSCLQGADTSRVWVLMRRSWPQTMPPWRQTSKTNSYGPRWRWSRLSQRSRKLWRQGTVGRGRKEEVGRRGRNVVSRWRWTRVQIVWWRQSTRKEEFNRWTV